MPPIPADQLRLTRLDATLWDEQGYAYVKHNYYGWQKAAQQEFVWRRTYKPIGQGGFGAVFCEECVKGSSKGTVRAVKSLQKPTSASPRAVDYSRELEAIARFSRPEYVRWFVQSSGWYEDDHAVFIVMEYLSYGSLQQYLGSGLPESQVKRIITQVLEGLRCMHAAGYSHRDVKPQVGRDYAY